MNIEKNTRLQQGTLGIILGMMTAKFHAMALLTCTGETYACNNSCIPLRNICILQPLPNGIQSIAPGDTADLGALFMYINGGLWQWVISIAVAVTILQVVIAGATLASGGQDTSNAKEKITWAIGGLLMLLLAGAILSTINPIGFTQ